MTVATEWLVPHVNMQAPPVCALSDSLRHHARGMTRVRALSCKTRKLGTAAEM